jgi:hypothetical protein
MTINLNSESDISSYVNTIWQDALLVARDNTVMTNLVTVFGDREGLAPRAILEYGEATINTIGEADDMTSQAFTPSTLSTLTPTELGAQYMITDSRIESDPFAVQSLAALDLGQAMATKMDTDLCAHFNAFHAGTIGTTGSVLTWGYFYAMAAVLRNAKAPLPYAFVCSPYMYYQLGRAAAVGATVTNSNKFQDSVMEKFYQGSASGIDIFVTANVETSTNDAYAGMFSRSALAIDIRRRPRLEPHRDPSRRAIELNMSAVYATGVWRPHWGVCGLFLNTAPSGV